MEFVKRARDAEWHRERESRHVAERKGEITINKKSESSNYETMKYRSPERKKYTNYREENGHYKKRKLENGSKSKTPSPITNNEKEVTSTKEETTPKMKYDKEFIREYLDALKNKSN